MAQLQEEKRNMMNEKDYFEARLPHLEISMEEMMLMQWRCWKWRNSQYNMQFVRKNAPNRGREKQFDEWKGEYRYKCNWIDRSDDH